MDPIVPIVPPSVPPSALTNNNPADLSFQVMPHSTTGGADLPQPPMDSEPSGSGKMMYIIIGIIVLLILGGLAYYFLGYKKSETAVVTQEDKLPKSFLTKYFNVDTCSDQATCGEEADSDKDGLKNYDEFKAGTSPINPDTDGDGIADGDEAHVYGTDPTLKFTDRRDIVAQNNWTDGYQIKNGFDPLTPGLKFTEVRLQKISENIAKFPLHEPTITTLKPATATTPLAKTYNIAITNNAFNPATLTINKGDTVIWTNNDTVPHHIASDPHPTHTSLPGLESNNFGKTQTYSFTFTKVGTWGYHDHLNPMIKGTVVVR